MSDPFSIASGSAGLVSLGLTLCKGLSEYISAARSHGEDVRNLERKLNTIQMFLEAVDVTLKGLHHSQGTHLPSDVIRLMETALDCSKDGMTRLRAYLEKCSGEARTSLTSSSARGPSNLRRVGKKAVFYFRKGTLKELEQILDGFQDPLSHSLDLLTARLLTSQSQNYRRITMDMSSFTTQLQGLQFSVARIEGRLSDASKTITAMSGNLSTVQESWQVTAKRVQEMAVSLQSLLPNLLSLFVAMIVPLLHVFSLAMRTSFQDIQRSILSLSADSILFEDMFGRSFRLQFSLVCEWRVFKAFLTTRFENTPGETAVASGQYRLLDGSNNMELCTSRREWANSIFPGSKVLMSLQLNDSIPELCPKCGSKLSYEKRGDVTKCTTIGCWTAFANGPYLITGVREESYQPDLPDVARYCTRVHYPIVFAVMQLDTDPDSPWARWGHDDASNGGR